jgi:transcriptional regulator with XRE-family HTH domain
MGERLACLLTIVFSRLMLKPMSPSARLASYRRSSALSGADTAAMLGCSRSAVWLIENQRRRPGRRLALAIERLTADWTEGPIRVSEWDAPAASGKAA